jgi:hypothetical protein
MNSIVARIFVFIVEVLAGLGLFVGAIAVLLVGITTNTKDGFIIALIVFVLCVFVFGALAIMIENYKLLKQIEVNTRVESTSRIVQSNLTGEKIDASQN